MRQASAALATVTANPATVASGVSSTVALTVPDASGTPIAGIPAAQCVLAVTGSTNTVTQPTGFTNASGQITGSFSSTTEEAKTASFTVAGLAITDTAGVTVEAASGNVYLAWDAATEVLSPLVAVLDGGGAHSFEDTWTDSAPCLQMVGDASSASKQSGVAFTFSGNPALNVDGVYCIQEMMFDATTLSRIAEGQMKMTLFRASGEQGWIDAGLGVEFTESVPGEYVVLQDTGNTRLDPGGPSDSRTGWVPTADTPFQVKYRLRYADGVGYVTTWINDVLVQEEIGSAQMGYAGATNLPWRFGYCYAQNTGAGNLVARLKRAWAGDFDPGLIP